MSKFIFPLNYKYSEKLLGIVEYKILLPLCCYAGLLFLVLHNLDFEFFFSASIFIVLFFPLFLLSINTINGEPIYSFIFAFTRFHLNSKVYLFKNDCKIN